MSKSNQNGLIWFDCSSHFIITVVGCRFCLFCLLEISIWLAWAPVSKLTDLCSSFICLSFLPLSDTFFAICMKFFSIAVCLRYSELYFQMAQCLSVWDLWVLYIWAKHPQTFMVGVWMYCFQQGFIESTTMGGGKVLVPQYRYPPQMKHRVV